MRHIDPSGLRELALAAAIAAALIAWIDQSIAWLLASAVPLLFGVLLYFFSEFPSVYLVFLKWLEKRYEVASPRRCEPLPSRTPPVCINRQDESGLDQGTMIGSTGFGPLPRPIIVDWTFSPRAAPVTETLQMSSTVKDEIIQLISDI